MLVAFVIVAVLSVCATAFAGHQILPPQSTFNNPAALVLVGGAQVPQTAYLALVLEIQAAAALKKIDLWIANAHSPIDLPILGIEKIIIGAVNSLAAHGLPSGSSLFLAGTLLCWNWYMSILTEFLYVQVTPWVERKFRTILVPPWDNLSQTNFH